jgi:uncharacterized protein YjbJ (UPF0337 family)
MGEGKVDDLKGRAKEAAGDLTGDKDLEREGKLDQATGKVKEKVEQLGDKVKDKASEVSDKAKDALHRDEK